MFRSYKSNMQWNKCYCEELLVGTKGEWETNLLDKLGNSLQREIKRRHGIPRLRDFQSSFTGKARMETHQKSSFYSNKDLKVKILLTVQFLGSQAWFQPFIFMVKYTWIKRAFMQSNQVEDRKWNSVNVWNDQWISIPYSFKVSPYNKPLWSNAKVNVLIDFQTGQWNGRLLENLFLTHEVEMINKILVSSWWP